MGDAADDAYAIVERQEWERHQVYKWSGEVRPGRDDDMDEPFYDPGGRSALRAGKRIYPCPTCGKPNRLTIADKRHGYQCDECADRAEGCYIGSDY